MILYGLPGVGKSTFAAQAPNPLFICTDGNFEWLGLPENNHVRVSTWKQAKEVINNIVLNKPEYKDFDTIVVDLVEDLYVWAEDEFCKRESIIHIGDYKSMGAGYSVVRKEFFAQISKLLSIDKNIILISHEADKPGKTKAGADTFTHIPSDKMSLTKQWNDLEGQVRYCLRCFTQDEEENGRVRKKRYLSLIPAQDEYGICRGADEENWPRECELNWNVFTSIIGLDTNTTATPTPAPVNKPTAAPAPTPKPAPVPRPRKPKVVEPAPAPLAEEEPKALDAATVEPAPVVEEQPAVVLEQEVVETPAAQPNPEVKVVSEPVEEPVNPANLTPEQRKQIVLARIQKMKGNK